MLPSVSRTSATGTDWINCMKPTQKQIYCIKHSFWLRHWKDLLKLKLTSGGLSELQLQQVLPVP